MIQNQQQAGPVDQVNPGLLNGVGPQPTLAGVQYVFFCRFSVK